MRIAIAGIGGVGGYYGGQLARYYDPGGDVAVAFIARGRHLAAIRKRGLSPGLCGMLAARAGFFLALNMETSRRSRK